MTTDALLCFRSEFPSLDNCVHFVSHSLGAMPRGARDVVNHFMDLWQMRSITAWDEWLPEIEDAGDRVAHLLGAPKGSVIMNTNVSAVQAVLASCLDYKPGRNGVVYSELEFPTVSYVWKAEERLGAKVTVVKSADGIGVDVDAFCKAIDKDTLVVPISHVLFRSAYIQDAKRIIARAHEVGAIVILDCYQSLGTVPVDVVDLDVDFATGGSVKWLSGGPGAAYLYVKPGILGKYAPRATGWFGHKKPFAFTMPEQDYADTTWRYVGGTPAILALYQARAGIELVTKATVAAIREKSLRQTGMMHEEIAELGATLRSPREAERRGGSVCFEFEGSAAVAQELNRRTFFCDHRPGAGIRVSPHYYTKDEEIRLLFSEIRKLRA